MIKIKNDLSLLDHPLISQALFHPRVDSKYEIENKRHPTETGSSEKEICDIISIDRKNNKRYIEVKSRSRETWNLELTTNQTKQVQKHKNIYFVYIVLNALVAPKLKIIRGDKINDIARLKISIPFNDWNKPENIYDQYMPF